MLKIENVDIYGWEAAIRGMRNPMNSWDMSDSYVGCPEMSCKECEFFCECEVEGDFIAGDNDLALMKKLANAGADHGKFLRYLIVQVDITAPFYWWKEFKTYRKGRKFMDDGDEILDPDDFELFIETNSCSTMHKIHAKEFTMDDFSCEHLYNVIEHPVTLKFDSENPPDPFTSCPMGCMEITVGMLNYCRENFLETKDKEWWWQMIQLLPSSYNQRRTVQLNYQVLKAMYHARRNHKLDEWHTFCDWIETLPCSELITGVK